MMKMKRALVPLVAMMVLTLTAGALFGPNLSPTLDAFAQTANGLLPGEENTADIVDQYGPSVVAVNVTVRGQRVNPLASIPPQLRPFFRQFAPQGHQQPQIERAAGSGFVVDGQGHILTNFHVVAHALNTGTIKLRSGAKITVRFANNDQQMAVKVIGTNRDYDLALLALKDGSQLPSSVKPIPLGDSDNLQVGQKAIAIGNPFNLQSTVTVGVVSAIQRKQPALVNGVTIPFVQTDAPINPGSSGSPLLNSAGKVIGINDEILAPNGTFVGVGFAIPAATIKKVLSNLKKGGVSGVTAQIPNKPRIGVTVISTDEYPKQVRQYLNLPEHGAVIVSTAPGGPADKAGLEPAPFAISAGGRNWPTGGDILIAADGQKLASVRDLQKLVLDHKAGETITLTVWRHGKTRKVDVTLAVIEAPGQSGQ